MKGDRPGPDAGVDAAVAAGLHRRVALRHRIGEREGRPLYTDAVGELSDGGDGTLVVATRRGPVRVRRDAVVAIRVVPPPPPRRAAWSAVARVESLCADAWPAQVDVALGGWRLRAAGGFTGRANSALAVADPGLPTADALARVREFAAAHGVPARVQTPIGSPWSRAVQREGWVLERDHEPGAEVAVLVADLPHLAAAVDVLPVRLADAPDAAWWSVSLAGPPDPAQAHVLAGPVPGALAFGLARDAAGAPVGAVRAAVVADHLHVSRLTTAPPLRRKGIATALVGAAARWGAARGARWAVLQVALRNDASLALCRRLGLREHHRYHYLVPPPS